MMNYEIFEEKYNFKNLRTFRQKTLERADHIIVYQIIQRFT